MQGLSWSGGLDALVEAIRADAGLTRRATQDDILAGAAAADGMNALIIEAADAVGALDDGLVDPDDVIAMSDHIRASHLAEWTALHGDDARGAETGFHLVRGDGGTTRLEGRKLIDKAADGVYHLGFGARDGALLNEDGDPSANVAMVAHWLTLFMTGQSVYFSDEAGGRIVGRDFNDLMLGGAGDDRLLGGDGNDTLRGGRAMTG